ncbi:MAG TPA: IS110 family transposase [Opitutus sp.]|nr:IS110 family transposase [Opitutus sp.]
MMQLSTPRFNRVIAFEVAKQSLVVHALPEDRQRRIANTAGAVRKLLRTAIESGDGQILVVCEATGGYEKHVLAEACALGLACHRAHGARVRHFAKFMGAAAKTDAIDGRMLALYGQNAQNLRLYRPPAIEQKAVRALKSRRDELLQMMIGETNRIEHADHASVRASLRTHVRILKLQLARIERELAQIIDETPRLAEQARLMQSVKGVGSETAAAIIAYFPELGSLSKGQAARLAGLAPIARDSGKASAPRHIEPGRAALRRTLYMAAVAAIRFNPGLRAFAAKLKAKGKPFKLIAAAVMRKLVVILNAVLASGEPTRQYA